MPFHSKIIVFCRRVRPAALRNQIPDLQKNSVHPILENSMRPGEMTTANINAAPSEKPDRNTFAEFLKAKGCRVVRNEGVDWYQYSRFMMPAYLPHRCPAVTVDMARQVRRQTKSSFVRWDSDFGKIAHSHWWYVLKRGPWSVESVKDKKKRWMIRQGKTNFSVRPLDYDEVILSCPDVAHQAVTRYRNPAAVESRQMFETMVHAGRQVPGVLEYIGCFADDKLVSYAENLIQDNAVWIEKIRQNPEFLNQYSSYGLMDGILEYYLNQKKLLYVLDGSRCIYHRTGFQDHLIRVFGFDREFCRLNVAYARYFYAAVAAVYPLKRPIWKFSQKRHSTFWDIVSGILLQEYIHKMGDIEKSPVMSSMPSPDTSCPLPNEA
jgi:hypothetical protein